MAAGCVKAYRWTGAAAVVFMVVYYLSTPLR